MMTDDLSVEFAVIAVSHYRINSYELTLFLFEQQKVGLFVFKQKSSVRLVL